MLDGACREDRVPEEAFEYTPEYGVEYIDSLSSPGELGWPESALNTVAFREDGA